MSMPPNLKQDEIIRTLRYARSHGFPDAIIAGGAVRDLFFRQPIRDIDVFVQHPCFNPKSKYYSTAANAGEDWKRAIWQSMGLQHPKSNNPEPDRVERCYDNYGKGGGKILSVYNVWKSWLPYQIIFTKIPPIDHVNKHFDFGICRAYCEGTKLRYTPDFMRDRENKTLTLCAEDMTEKEVEYALFTHLPRLVFRFPYFNLRATPENQALVDKLMRRP